MTTLKVRKAVPGEEAQIHEAHMRSIREICIHDHGEEEIKGWGYRPLGDRWIKAVRDEIVWVIDNGTSIYGVGYIMFLKNEGKLFGYINALYLTPEVTGKGLAKNLFDKLLSQAKDKEVSYIKLDSTITAFNFYKKIGFIENGEMQSVEIGGLPVRCIPMIMNL